MTNGCRALAVVLMTLAGLFSQAGLAGSPIPTDAKCVIPFDVRAVTAESISEEDSKAGQAMVFELLQKKKYVAVPILPESPGAELKIRYSPWSERAGAVRGCRVRLQAGWRLIGTMSEYISEERPSRPGVQNVNELQICFQIIRHQLETHLDVCK